MQQSDWFEVALEPASAQRSIRCWYESFERDPRHQHPDVWAKVCPIRLWIRDDNLSGLLFWVNIPPEILGKMDNSVE